MPDILAKRELITARAVRQTQESPLLFFIAFLFFLLALAGYGGLFLLVRAQNETKDELTAQIQEKENNLRTDLIDQIFLLQNRLTNINTVLTSHVFTSNVFKVIETNTHPQTRFTTLTLSPDSRKADMGGETVSYAVLSRQINLFERDPMIEKVEFGGLARTSNNLLGFRVTLFFRPELFSLRPQ